MPHSDLILTLAAGLAAALVLGYITQRLGLSPIVGYLLAGVVVGPHTPGVEANHDLAVQLAEVGVVLLMFGVGLHFHLKELLAVRHIAIPGAIGQSVAATLLGTVAAYFFGWDWVAGLVFGLAISVASTVVLIRVLADNNDLHTPTGHIAVGWLVVEDLFTVLVLVLLPALFARAPEAGTAAGAMPTDLSQVPLALVIAAGKIGLLIALVIVGGGWLIPAALTLVAQSRSRELFTLAVLVVALGIAYGSARLFGVSMALGAFLAGMVVGRSDFSQRAASEALPMRDAFAVLFFVSVGMLFDPRSLLAAPWQILATLAIVLLGKPLAALAIVLLLRYPLRVGLSVSVALAQIGEFSFILADLGRELKLLPDSAMSSLVAASIVSISINPLLYRLVDPLEAWLERFPLLRPLCERPEPQEVATGEGVHAVASHRAVIIGYGPVGRTLSRLLRDNEIQPTVIEMNLETVQRLKEEGRPVVYGDARHRAVLEAAGAHEAGTLILSASNLRNAEEILRTARDLNPRIRILARANYLREEPALKAAGAHSVFTAEGDVALAMTAAILGDLGALPEQIDRERDRVRAELFGVPANEGEATLPPEEPRRDAAAEELPRSAPPAAEASDASG